MTTSRPGAYAITKTELSVVDQDTGRSSAVPDESRSWAEKARVSPTVRLALSGTTVTVATGAGVCTVIVTWPVFPRTVARRIVCPGARARMSTDVPVGSDG